MVGSNARQTRIDSGGLSGSRFGLDVKEDLGGGMRAFAKIENGFNIDNGTAAQNGLLFGRQAYVGLGGGFGSVQMGRNYSPYFSTLVGVASAQGATLFDATNGATLGGADVLATAAYLDATSPTAAQATAAATALNKITNRFGAWTGYTPRINNSIRFDSADIGGLKVAAIYGLGENKVVSNAGSVSATRTVGLSASYTTGPLSLGFAMQSEQLLKSATDTLKLDNALLGGSYDFGAAQLFASYNRAKYSGLDAAKEFAIGTKIPMGPLAFIAQYGQSKSDDLGKSKSLGLELQYSLSKRTTTYAAYNSTKLYDGLVPTNSILAAGIRHTF